MPGTIRASASGSGTDYRNSLRLSRRSVLSGGFKAFAEMGERFVACDREQSFLLPPDVREWLAPRHLAWFVIDAVAEMNLDGFHAAYRVDGPADECGGCDRLSTDTLRFRRHGHRDPPGLADRLLDPRAGPHVLTGGGRGGPAASPARTRREPAPRPAHSLAAGRSAPRERGAAPDGAPHRISATPRGWPRTDEDSNA
jgi:hypothetical protein